MKMTNIKTELRTRRMALNLTQKKLAQKIGYSEIHIIQIEANQRGLSEEIKFKLSVLEGGKEGAQNAIETRLREIRAELEQIANEVLK